VPEQFTAEMLGWSFFWDCFDQNCKIACRHKVNRLWEPTFTIDMQTVFSICGLRSFHLEPAFAR